MGTIDGFLLCVCGVLGGAFDDTFGDTSDDSMSEAGAGAVGGLIGRTEGSIELCYVTGNVTSTGTGNYIGGLVGYNRNSGTVSGVVYDSTITGNGNTGRLVGTYDSANTTGYYYNTTLTGIYGTNGTAISALTIENVTTVLDILDTDHDGYYFDYDNNDKLMLYSSIERNPRGLNGSGTELDPCKTIGKPGSLLDTSSKMSKRSGGGTRIPFSFLVHCSGVNL